MVKITEGMKLNAKMVKTVLEGMLQCKVEVGWSFSSGISMSINVYDKDSKYNYQKYEIDYIDDDSKDDSNYCAELIYQMLNGMFTIYHESTAEERFISDILEETECKKLFILDGRLCDSNSEISVNLSSLDVCKYDRTEANFILIEDSGDKYEVGLYEGKIYFIEDK